MYGIREMTLPIEQRNTPHIETRCAILRACMANPDTPKAIYSHWRAELRELEAELTARDVAAEACGCTCGDAYDSRIVDVPLCRWCVNRLIDGEY